ncbi:ABC transporter ATP-binding protein [Pseudactinotalea terrae]|uniref:ABC transporter ATP-binding protein n=1 Tax=Pseudactinotalea terrae TaxID=1743262 RepID=UPI0012E10986
MLVSATAPAQRKPADTSTVATLLRLLPFVRPALPRISIGMLCALGAGLCALAIPQVLESLVDGPLAGAATSGDTRGLWLAVGAVLGLGLLEVFFVFLRRRMILTPTTYVEWGMRTTLFKHLQDLPLAFHDQWPGGQLLSRAMTDLNMLRRWMAFGIVMLVVNFATVGVGIALMIRTAGPLGWVYLLGAIPMAILSFRFSRRFRRIARMSQDQAGDLATTVEESVHGIRVLKAYGRGPEAYKNFASQAGELRNTEMTKARQMSAFTFSIISIPECVLGACVFWGVWLVTQGDLTIGALGAFFATAAVINGPVEQLGQLLSMSLTAKTSVDRYFEVLDSENTVADPQKPVRLEEVRGEVRFEAVRFHYPDAPPIDLVPAHTHVPHEAPREEVLTGVDLTVRPGETMALVGLTGSGKTTMAALVPRLFDVTSGAVLLDGVDIRAMTREHLRTQVAIAFEDATLFSASVRENVLLGAPPQARTEADLQRALDIAQAGFVHKLPFGVDTTIGEEGMSLSGGQRQRLALARAIAARPRVLVLDDPLSALDVETEERVTVRLREELSDTTVLVVAHRPSTVALADRVAVLQEGRVTGVGTHSELLVSHLHYRFVISSLIEDEEFDRARGVRV